MSKIYNSARSFRYMDRERGICRTGNGAFTFRSLAWTLDLHHCIAIEQTFCPSHLAAVHHSFCHLVLDRRTASLTHPCLPASNLDRLVVRVHPWFLPPIHICNTEHSYFPNHRPTGERRGIYSVYSAARAAREVLQHGSSPPRDGQASFGDVRA